MAAIVVEFVLIIVSLISCVILGGFAFGTITIYVPPAMVAAQVASCSYAGNATDCKLILVNQGTKNVSTEGTCALSVPGAGGNGTVTNGGVVPAGGSLQGVTCAVHSSPLSPGMRVSGSLPLTDGGSVFFTGTAN